MFDPADSSETLNSRATMTSDEVIADLKVAAAELSQSVSQLQQVVGRAFGHLDEKIIPLRKPPL